MHHGPCSDEELRRPVSIADVDAQLATRVSTAEAAVRRQVRDQQLTQEQFDSLVSFAFNTGAAGAQTVLGAVNRGVFEAAATQMNNTVYIHPRDANGHRLAPIRVQGLVNRRREESAAFQTRQNRR